MVINRFEPSFLGVTEELITKALSRPVRWKIPDDYDAARQMQNSATPLTVADSPISRLIMEMTSSVTGHPVSQEKKKGFSFKGLGRSITEKLSTADKPPTLVAPAQSQAGATPTATGAPPTVAWATPEPITCGTALTATQLNATASAPGTFVYTPGPGYVLPVGTHTLWVTFTQADAPDLSPVQAAVSISVSKATPVLRWQAPSALSCGTALSSAQLNASTPVPGTYEYKPAAGEVLEAGTHTLSVTFTPTNAASYTTAQASVSVTVAKVAPTITWPTPESITCGMPLSAAQLNATASVPGTFEYRPAAGEMLAAGTHTLTLTFTPSDVTQHTTAEATVSIAVSRATPTIAWLPPDPLAYGDLLSAAQLNATASVPGTFEYTPGEGSLLAAGEHTPTVFFTPADLSDYTPAQAAVRLVVAKATPTIAWQAPDPIPSGTALSATQLNATTSVPGTFAYTPAAGEKLAKGEHTLSATFTPMDTINYTTAEATVPLTVTELSPVRITWLGPAVISYGTPLSALELNASASVLGTFVYAPGAGDVLPAGRHTLTATFTPADIEKYATAQATVALVVEGPNEIDVLLSAATQTPFAQSDAADSTGRAGGEREADPSGDGSTGKVKRETRTYKGAIYEKGDDGQWHLQQN